MRKIGYYLLIGIEALAVIATIALSFGLPVIFADYWQALLCIVIAVPLLAIVCFGLEFRNKFIIQDVIPDNKPDGNHTEDAGNNKTEVDPTQQQGEENANSPAQENPQDEEPLEKKWSKAMYQRYNSEWDHLFKHIQRPLSQEDKGRIALLLWNISSQTINFIKESNSDINRVRYNLDGVKMINENLSLDDIKLEEFYVDQTTVKVKAIAIYEWLKDLGAQSDTSAFGYRLKLNDNTH